MRIYLDPDKEPIVYLADLPELPNGILHLSTIAHFRADLGKSKEYNRTLLQMRKGAPTYTEHDPKEYDRTEDPDLEERCLELVKLLMMNSSPKEKIEAARLKTLAKLRQIKR